MSSSGSEPQPQPQPQPQPHQEVVCSTLSSSSHGRSSHLHSILPPPPPPPPTLTMGVVPPPPPFAQAQASASPAERVGGSDDSEMSISSRSWRPALPAESDLETSGQNYTTAAEATALLSLSCSPTPTPIASIPRSTTTTTSNAPSPLAVTTTTASSQIGMRLWSPLTPFTPEAAAAAAAATPAPPAHPPQQQPHLEGILTKLRQVAYVTQSVYPEENGAATASAQGFTTAQSGAVLHIRNLHPVPMNIRPTYLGQLRATSIAGNDLLSSILYTSGIAIFYSGKYAPLAILLVCVTLHQFQAIYAEVGSAFPFNGGSYNVLLNTAHKLLAAVAACLSILSYLATALVSGSSAIQYISGLPLELDSYWTLVGMFGVFTVLMLIGLSESANVATAIFLTHLLTLTLLTAVTCLHLLTHSAEGLTTLWANFSDTTSPAANPQGPFAVPNLFYGFASAFLGITGFETSCNYIEEQNPGVFPKTLRNMWALVTAFNPTLCVLCLAVMPLPECVAYRDQLLTHLAELTGGPVLRKVVAVDGFLVLSGSVLTAFVGVTGLLERLSIDRVLPQLFTARNHLRQTCHYIILGFFALCVSLWTLSQDMTVLAGIFGVSFISVMLFVVLANALLRLTRPELRRSPRASWKSLLFAFAMASVGLVGTFQLQSEIFSYFAVYFAVVFSGMVAMFFRVKVLDLVYFAIQNVPTLRRHLEFRIQRKVQEICDHPVVFFCKRGELSTLSRGIRYILTNEQSRTIYVLHCCGGGSSSTSEAESETFAFHVRVLDRQYPRVRISCVVIHSTEFTPGVVEGISQGLGIGKNLMFIGCPSEGFSWSLQDFGGVRVIM